ncbi:MAG: radical SAM protein [bacterium]|nr:radical SAM protein [bacterium]
MAKLEFNDLSFEKIEDGLRITFLKNFYFDVPEKDLIAIGKYKAKGNSIEFDVSDTKASKKFNFLVSNSIINLKSSLNGKNAVYVHRNSGIPLLGDSGFGIVDRNSSIIEVKPITGCNLNCIFCSVDEGLSSQKVSEFIVEEEYLVEEFTKIAEFKGCELEAHINAHGEPMLYAPLARLVKDLKEIKNVKTISMDTNGMFLDKKIIDELAEAGLTRINISLNAFDEKVAKKLAGTKEHDVEKIKDALRYAKGKIDLLVAPILVPGFNDDEMGKLIEFAKEIGAEIGIQNFLNYRRGRNPAKAFSWEKFYELLKELEKKHNVKLIKSKEDFKVTETKKIPKPFRKGQTIKAKIACNGRYENEKIAVADERSITVIGCGEKKDIRVKLLRDKHNIFFGKCV